MIEIKIDGISEKSVKFGKEVAIVSGNKKYIFYDKVKSGDFSKAYAAYKNADWGVGDTVSCEVSEQNKPFKGKDGKMIDWTERRIMYFQEGEQGPGTAKNGQNLPQDKSLPSKLTVQPFVAKTPNGGDLQVLARLEGLEKRMAGIEGELNDRTSEARI